MLVTKLTMHFTSHDHISKCRASYDHLGDSYQGHIMLSIQVNNKTYDYIERFTRFNAGTKSFFCIAVSFHSGFRNLGL